MMARTRFRIRIALAGMMPWLLAPGPTPAAARPVPVPEGHCTRLRSTGGPTVPTSLVDLVRLRKLEVESDLILAMAYARRLGEVLPNLTFEAEASLA